MHISLIEWRFLKAKASSSCLHAQSSGSGDCPTWLPKGRNEKAEGVVAKFENGKKRGHMV